MLEDVRNAGIVGGVGLKSNREYIILILPSNMQVIGTSLIML